MLINLVKIICIIILVGLVIYFLDLYYVCCPEYIFQDGHNLLSYFYLFEMATILNYGKYLAPGYVVQVSQKPLSSSCLFSSC